jgi:hypothetical protein
MKNNRIGRVLSLLAVLLGPLVSLDVLSSFAQSQQASSVQSTQMPTTDALPEGRLTRIDARRVCMVRNHAFEEPQLPIDIKGRTY